MAKKDESMTINDVKKLIRDEAGDLIQKERKVISQLMSSEIEKIPTPITEEEIKKLIPSIDTDEILRELAPKIKKALDEAIEDIDVDIGDDDINRIIESVGEQVEKSIKNTYATKESLTEAGYITADELNDILAKKIPTKQQVEGAAVNAVNEYMKEVFKATGMDPNALGGKGGFNLMSAAGMLAGMMGGKGDTSKTPDKSKEIQQAQPEPKVIKASPLKCTACNNEKMNVNPVARTIHGHRLQVLVCPDCETENIIAKCSRCDNMLLVPGTIEQNGIFTCPSCGTPIKFFPTEQ